MAAFVKNGVMKKWRIFNVAKKTHPSAVFGRGWVSTAQGNICCLSSCSGQGFLLAQDDFSFYGGPDVQDIASQQIGRVILDFGQFFGLCSGGAVQANPSVTAVFLG